MTLNKPIFLKISFLACLLLYSLSCSVKYSFTGASISPEIKTISIQDFPNLAPLVNPQLTVKFIEKMKDRFINQTSLVLINGAGDLNFEGEFVDYSTMPVDIQGGDVAAKNRLTIVVKVRFSNAYDPKQNFDERFSRYADYDNTKTLEEAQNDLVETILDEIIDDIFNKSVANW